MEVGSDASLWWDRGREAKEVFHAERNTHKEMIFHLGDRNDFIGFAKALMEGIVLKHATPARYIVFCKSG